MINDGYCVIEGKGKQMDGISQIVDEWKTSDFFDVKGYRMGCVKYDSFI